MKKLAILTWFVTLLIVYVTGLISCSKNNITPQPKAYTSMEGKWKINQPIIGYNCTFNLVQGDSVYPYYPSDISGSCNGNNFSYKGVNHSSPGIVINPDNTITILLTTSNTTVYISDLIVNNSFTQMSSATVNGYLDINGTYLSFTNPFIITR